MLRQTGTAFLIAACVLQPGVETLAARAAGVESAMVKIYTIRNRPDYYNPWSMQGPQGLSIFAPEEL